MAEEKIIDLLSLEIFPLISKQMLRGIFIDEDSEFKHLIDWIRTRSWHPQQEKKSKTYLAIYQNKTIAYITISTGLFKGKITDISNSTNFEFQVLLLGKLYVAPQYRNSGIGKKLLNLILDIARNLDEMVGCLGVIVDSNDNQNTVNFYKNWNFAQES